MVDETKVKTVQDNSFIFTIVGLAGAMVAEYAGMPDVKELCIQLTLASAGIIGLSKARSKLSSA